MGEDIFNLGTHAPYRIFVRLFLSTFTEFLKESKIIFFAKNASSTFLNFNP
jgi:hypothetical protein